MDRAGSVDTGTGIVTGAVWLCSSLFLHISVVDTMSILMRILHCYSLDDGCLLQYH